MKFLFKLVLVIYSISSFGQKKEDIYLFFKPDSPDTCNYNYNLSEENKKNILFFHKYNIGFIYCNQAFIIKSNTMINEVSNSDIEKFNIVDINYFLNQTQKNKNVNPNNLFNKIYVIQLLEGQMIHKYLKFEVYWEAPQLWQNIKE